MRAELEKLLITNEFYEEITGISIDEIKYGITPDIATGMSQETLDIMRNNSSFESILDSARLKKTKFKVFFEKLWNYFINILFSILLIAFIESILLVIIYYFFNNPKFLMELYFPALFISISLGFWMGFSITNYTRKQSIYQRRSKIERLESLYQLRRLFIELENYNKIIKSIDVKEQINYVLNSINEPIQKEVLDALSKIQENLIKALKVERILRENKDFSIKNLESLNITFAELQFTDISKQASEYSGFVEQILDVGISLNQEFEILRDGYK